MEVSAVQNSIVQISRFHSMAVIDNNGGNVRKKQEGRKEGMKGGEGRKKGWMDGWMDGWMEIYNVFLWAHTTLDFIVCMASMIGIRSNVFLDPFCG